jgi:hypothetical protein
VLSSELGVLEFGVLSLEERRYPSVHFESDEDPLCLPNYSMVILIVLSPIDMVLIGKVTTPVLLKEKR